MSDEYSITLTTQQRNLMETWHKQDPVDKWEAKRNHRIKKIQGNANPYIDNSVNISVNFNLD